ncbi:hypothetical protein QZH41_015396, partial [Actinostola sp. cb2023]
PPPAPENVQLQKSYEDGAAISWEKPKLHKYFSIKGYVIEYWMFGSTTKKTTDSYKGVASEVKGLKSDNSYVARVLAVNSYGKSDESKSIDFRTKSKFLRDWQIVLIVLLSIIILIVVVGIIICCRRRIRKRQKIKKSEKKMFPMTNVGHEVCLPPDDKDEGIFLRSYANQRYSFLTDKWSTFPKEQMVLQNRLGSGEFGEVYKCQLIDGDTVRECAVKTFKGSDSVEGYRDLHKELEIMAHVGYHPNLINLIGAVNDQGMSLSGRLGSLFDHKLYVIVEYAVHGSLIDYVRLSRNEENVIDFKYTKRLSIALDVAKGMAYLTEKRCVHRDLAARNVLLAENFVAKVADFGMSRDIYESGVYEKTTTGKLPTRWMAIESLERRLFTTETDAWSFGVLLWEIETK